MEIKNLLAPFAFVVTKGLIVFILAYENILLSLRAGQRGKKPRSTRSQIFLDYKDAHL